MKNISGIFTMTKIVRLLFLVAFCFLSLSSFAAKENAGAPGKTLTVEMRNKTVKEVLNYIEKKSDYVFFYSSGTIDTDRKVSVSVKNKPVTVVLDQLFKDTGVKYSISGNQISLSGKGAKKSASVSPRETAPDRMLKGKVLDSETQEPLVGVSVLAEGENRGAVTDLDGNYEIGVSKGTKLQFSYVGYKKKTESVGDRKELNVNMVMDNTTLSDLVVVGYGTQRKEALTGSISSVKSDELTVAPLPNVSAGLAGRLPGLIAVQNNGQPGSSSASLNIRGFGDALVIVDGVESSLDNIDTNQIESVSILKDGAASIYGARAGNGVLLVTTKRGVVQKPTVTLNSTFSWQGATAMLKPANAGQRAEMEREAWIQAGKPETDAPFTLEAIQKYYEGTDPAYPNTDWYKEVIRDWAPEMQHNVSVRGGNETVKYYGFFGYLNQQTMIKKHGGGYERFNFQSNADLKIFSNMTLHVDIAYSQENRNYATRSMAPGNTNMWQDYWNTNPYYAAHFPDPTKTPYAFGAGTGGIHVSSNRELSGYSDTKNENLHATAALDYRFKYVPGLALRVFESARKENMFGKTFCKPVNLYTYDPSTDVYTLAGTFNGTKAQLNEETARASTFTQQYSLSYDNLFNDHRVSAMALFEIINTSATNLRAGRKNFLTSSIEEMFAGSSEGMTNDGTSSEMGRESFIARVNYSYKDKYLFQGIFRADASAKFPPGKRWGYFPSVSVGWVISKENFMREAEFMDNLKIRASYGQSGNDGVGNFQYLAGYNLGHFIILDGEPSQGLVSRGIANPNLTWERVKIANVGIDFSFWNRALYGEVDGFYRKRTGIPGTRLASLPSSFGAGLPAENLNSLDNRGFELRVGTAGFWEGLTYDVSANISWTRSKWTYLEEADETDPDRRRIYLSTGRWTDVQFGYLSDGLFKSMDEILDAPIYESLGGNASLRPGDVKYKDINDDGIINWRDQVEIGQGGTPHWMYGFNINLAYKGFDLSALFQGAFGYNQFVQSDNYSTTLYKNRWTEDNPDAEFARLGGAESNKWFSDFYSKRAGYLRLKTASVGYNLPAKILHKIRLSAVRIYFSGTNLFTINRLAKYGIDPEAANVGSYYPQQRTLSVGLNVSF